MSDLPKVLYQSGRYFIVAVADGDMVIARLVDSARRGAGPAVPLQSILNHTSGWDWQPFAGDQAAVLAHVAA